MKIPVPLINQQQWHRPVDLYPEVDAAWLLSSGFSHTRHSLPRQSYQWNQNC